MLRIKIKIIKLPGVPFAAVFIIDGSRPQFRVILLKMSFRALKGKTANSIVVGFFSSLFIYRTGFLKFR